MSERSTRKQREALIAGDQATPLSPDQAAELPLLADLLADPLTWAEPRPELELAVVAAVANAEPSTVSSITRRMGAPRWRRIVASVAAGVVILTGAMVMTRGGTSPDFEAELAATALAPRASGSVDITHNRGGFRLTLDAGGLPPLRTGEFYQAWLKDARGTLVPIGTFSSSDETTTLWSGVSPEDFPIITVTIESSDNDQASSGRVVLAGKVRSR